MPQVAPEPPASPKQAAPLSATARAILDRYGPYVPPSLERAQRHYLHVCDHHVMFSLFRTTVQVLLWPLEPFSRGALEYRGTLWSHSRHRKVHVRGT